MAMRAHSAAITIRPVHDTDLDAIAAIERDVFNDPWTRRSFADLVHARHVVFLVATDTSDVLGYAIVLVAGPESELANLAVARMAHRRGIGWRLLGEAVSEAQRRGCAEMYLEVRDSNLAARELYASAGFEAIGRRVRYYARPIEDAIVMKARLEGRGLRVQGRGKAQR